jgi:aminoglycoside 3-N-acetyltransferase
VILDVIAGLEVAGRHAVQPVPNLRTYVNRWVRRAPRAASPITLDELRREILAAGIEPGRDLMVHASWDGIQQLQAKPSEAFQMLRDLVGEHATLMMPTQAAETMKAGELFYDVDRSISTMGLLSECLRRTKGAKRSPFPIAPVAALGPRAEAYTRDHSERSDGTPWGRGSAYWQLGEQRGQVLVLGIDFVRTLTLMHCAFDVLGPDNPIPDFYEPVTWIVRQGGQEARVTVKHQRRVFEQHLATFAFRRMVRSSGTIVERSLRGLRIAAVDAQRFLEWHLPIARATGMPYWHSARFVRTGSGPRRGRAGGLAPPLTRDGRR